MGGGQEHVLGRHLTVQHEAGDPVVDVQSFMELRRIAGLSLVLTKEVLTEMAQGLIDLAPR